MFNLPEEPELFLGPNIKNGITRTVDLTHVIIKGIFGIEFIYFWLAAFLVNLRSVAIMFSDGDNKLGTKH